MNWCQSLAVLHFFILSVQPDTSTETPVWFIKTYRIMLFFKLSVSLETNNIGVRNSVEGFPTLLALDCFYLTEIVKDWGGVITTEIRSGSKQIKYLDIINIHVRPFIYPPFSEGLSLSQ